MTSAAVISQRVLPRTRVTSVPLVIGAAALTALAASGKSISRLRRFRSRVRRLPSFSPEPPWG